MNKKIKILIIVLAVLLVFNLAKNGLVQAAVAMTLSRAAHVPVSIGSTNLGLVSSSIDLKKIRFHNPRGFPEKVMLEISRVFINLDPGSLFKGQVHLEEVRLNLKELIVIKNRDGRLNVDAVKPREEEKQKKEVAKAKKEPPKLKIDKLYLSIGRVVYKDYSYGSEPKVEVFEINIQDRVFTNIEDPNTVVSLIMFEALTRTTLSRLVNLDLSSFQEGAEDALVSGVSKALGEGGAAVEGVLSLFK